MRYHCNFFCFNIRKKWNLSLLVFKHITISSRAAFPALSPIPFIVHSTCLAPAIIADKELETAKPKSLWQCTEITALSIFVTLFLTLLIRVANSPGIEYPTVSGYL